MNNETMLAAVIRAPGDFGVEEISKPVCPDDGMILKVLACGLCGSDLRTLRSGHHRIKLPFVVGHEICGVIDEIGNSCRTAYSTGQTMAVGPLVYCDSCAYCRQGKFELCSNYREIAQHWYGGLAEYIAIPAAAIARGTMASVAANVDPAFAAVAEPIASCVHAQEKSSIGLGDSVVIIGAGPIGCIHASLARLRGADKIIMVDVNQDRLKLSEQFAPDYRIDATAEDPVAAVKAATNGLGASVDITANPVPQTQVQAVEMAQKGGRVLFFGGLPPEKACPGINTNLIHYNALHIIGTTIFTPHHFDIALNLILSGKIPGDKLVSHRFKLTEFEQGAKMALAGKVVKAVFMPGSRVAG